MKQDSLWVSILQKIFVTRSCVEQGKQKKSCYKNLIVEHVAL